MHGEYKVPGGKLVVADLETDGERLTYVQVSGDFFLHPDSALDTINGALLGMPADSGEREFADAVTRALGPDIDLYGITPEGVAIAVRRALDPDTGSAS